MKRSSMAHLTPVGIGNIERVAEILQHAAWHCKFGSGTSDREPEDGDLQAHVILMRLFRGGL